MARFDGVAPEAMNTQQREVAEAMINGPRGHAGGLMGLWLHHPEFAARVQRVGEYLRFGGIWPGNVRELVILLVARDWQCDHEWGVHVPMAEKHGLRPEIIDAIREGEAPDFADPAGASRVHLCLRNACPPPGQRQCVRCGAAPVRPCRDSGNRRPHRPLYHRRGDAERRRVRPFRRGLRSGECRALSAIAARSRPRSSADKRRALALIATRLPPALLAALSG